MGSDSHHLTEGTGRQHTDSKKDDNGFLLKVQFIDLPSETLSPTLRVSETIARLPFLLDRLLPLLLLYVELNPSLSASLPRGHISF